MAEQTTTLYLLFMDKPDWKQSLFCLYFGVLFWWKF